jgi:hypothetical protein
MEFPKMSIDGFHQNDELIDLADGFKITGFYPQ